MTDSSLQHPRILIIRLSALGDILHALPVLAALRRVHPEAHIGWVVQDGGAPLVEGHPMLDRVHIIPRRAMKKMPASAKFGALQQLRSEIRSERYDYAIDLQGLAKSAIWGWLSGATTRVGFKGEDARELSSLFYNRAIAPPSEARHVIQKNLALLRALNIQNPSVEFPIHFRDEILGRGRAIWGCDAASLLPRVVLNPGAGWVTKQWPAAKYGELAARLAREHHARVVFAWGPGEEPLVREAMSAPGASADFATTVIPPNSGVYVMPPTSFVELGAVISLAHLFVAGDTGPLHFAAALGVPAIGIFGASDPVRNGPWGKRSKVIQLSEPSCIPCWKTQCAWREPLACLRNLETEQVYCLCEEAIRTKTDHKG